MLGQYRTRYSSGVGSTGHGLQQRRAIGHVTCDALHDVLQILSGSANLEAARALRQHRTPHRTRRVS
eukprot:3940314-Rhodomonas_salina.2